MHRFYTRILFYLTLLLFPVQVHAVELRIFDCEGTTRAVREVEELSKNEVHFRVLDDSGQCKDGIPVTLTQVLTNRQLRATSRECSAKFQEVEPGAWTVASLSTDVVFTTVELGTPSAGGISSGALLGGLAVAGGAAALAGGGGGGGGDDGDIKPTPTATPEPTVTPIPTFTPTPTPEETPRPTPTVSPTPDTIDPITEPPPEILVPTPSPTPDIIKKGLGGESADEDDEAPELSPHS